MKQQVAVQTLRITRKEEVRYFSLRLPLGVSRIIGIETGLRLLEQDFIVPYITPNNQFILPQSTIAGTLKLQSPGNSNLFYIKEVVKSDASLMQGDFSFTYFTVNYKDQNAPPDFISRNYNAPVSYWKPSPWTHNRLTEEESISFEPSSRIINVLYTDEYGKAMCRDCPYVVSVYIWYETAECKTN